jgi:hypothetical protein
MKLNKKLVCLSAAAVMAISSVSALAANTNPAGAPVSGTVAGYETAPVPVTANNSATLKNVEALYDAGFYFEAYHALEAYTPADVYEADYVNSLFVVIKNSIDRVIIDEAFGDVEAFIADGYYAEARNVLINDVFALAKGYASSSSLTGTEVLYYATDFTLDDWNRARALEAEVGSVLGDIVTSVEAANNYVLFHYDIPDGIDFYTVRVGNRYDVHLSGVLATGKVQEYGEIDITADGDVTLNTTPFAAKSVWNNPIG